MVCFCFKRWLFLSVALVVYLSSAVASRVDASTATAVQSAASPSLEGSADERLRRVLAAVAAQPLVAVPFVERRASSLYVEPVESRGTLSYKPAGGIDKVTTRPIRERVSITADTITIDPGGGAPPKVLRLAEQAHLAAYAGGLRAILSGDEKQLRQVFSPRLTGSLDNWKLLLQPKDAALRRLVKQIVVSGAGANLRVLETTEINGDVVEMTLGAR